VAGDGEFIVLQEFVVVVVFLLRRQQNIEGLGDVKRKNGNGKLFGNGRRGGWMKCE
jgi:hypothetical protein